MIEATNDVQKIGQALSWFVSLLNRYTIPYQICGGMAAKAYGATRPLVDIDLYASLQDSSHFQAFLEEIQPYIIREFTVLKNLVPPVLFAYTLPRAYVNCLSCSKRRTVLFVSLCQQ